MKWLTYVCKSRCIILNSSDMFAPQKSGPLCRIYSKVVYGNSVFTMVVLPTLEGRRQKLLLSNRSMWTISIFA